MSIQEERRTWRAKEMQADPKPLPSHLVLSSHLPEHGLSLQPGILCLCHISPSSLASVLSLSPYLLSQFYTTEVQNWVIWRRNSPLWVMAMKEALNDHIPFIFLLPEESNIPAPKPGHVEEDQRTNPITDEEEHRLDWNAEGRHHSSERDLKSHLGLRIFSVIREL